MSERITYAASGEAEGAYSSIPSGYHQRLELPGLAKEPDYPAICDDLWGQVSDSSKPEAYAWIRLFQAVVFEDPSLWPPRMLTVITNAEGDAVLLWLAELLNFEGSLIIFRFPEITRGFLIRARALGGDHLCQKMRVKLYSSCGPQSRSYQVAFSTKN